MNIQAKMRLFPVFKNDFGQVIVDPAGFFENGVRKVECSRLQLLNIVTTRHLSRPGNR